MSPALMAAIATIVPTVSTRGARPGPIQPAAANTEAMPSRVTSVIPEVGCDETPTIPTMRAATVTNSTPKTPTPAAQTARWQRRDPPPKTPGTSAATSTTAATPPKTNAAGQVAVACAPAPVARRRCRAARRSPRATASERARHRRQVLAAR